MAGAVKELEQLLKRHDLEYIRTCYESSATGRALYQVRHRLLGVQYACKRLNLKREDERTVRREVAALNRLPFGLAPRCHALLREGGFVHLLLDWVDGQSMADRYPEPPTEGRALGERLLALEYTAERVAALHRQKLIHRDLKPENVLLQADRQQVRGACLVDLGVAVQDRGLEEGTRGYRAPEQALRRDRSLSFATDIFALGQIGWFLVTGAPHTLEYNADYSGWRDDGPPLLPAFVPDGVAVTLERATAFDPGSRQRKAADLVHELRRLRNRLQGGKR